MLLLVVVAQQPASSKGTSKPRFHWDRLKHKISQRGCAAGIISPPAHSLSIENSEVHNLNVNAHRRLTATTQIPLQLKGTDIAIATE